MRSQFSASCPDLSGASAWRTDPSPEPAGQADGRSTDPHAQDDLHRNAPNDGPERSESDRGRPSRDASAPASASHGETRGETRARSRHDSRPTGRNDPGAGPSGLCGRRAALPIDHDVERAVEPDAACYQSPPNLDDIFRPGGRRRRVLWRADEMPGLTRMSARLLAKDPRMPEPMRAVLHEWRPDQTRRANALLGQFQKAFQGLATPGNVRHLPDFDFNSDVLMDLRDSAVLCVAAGLDQMESVQAALDHRFSQERQVHLLTPMLQIPTLLLAWFVPVMTLGLASHLNEQAPAANTSAASRLQDSLWSASASLMGAAPLLAALDSLMDGIWHALPKSRLLRPDTEFNNPLATQLQRASLHTDVFDASFDGLNKVAWGAILRAGVNAAAVATWPSTFKLTPLLVLDLALEQVSQVMVPSLMRRQLPLDTPSRQQRHLMALSTDEFGPWLAHPEPAPMPNGKQLPSAFAESLRGMTRPSVIARAALVVAPAFALRGFAMSGWLGAKAAPGTPTASPGEPTAEPSLELDPLSVYLISTAASVITGASVILAQIVRRAAERHLDPVMEPWMERTRQALHHGVQQLRQALWRHSDDAAATDPEDPTGPSAAALERIGDHQAALGDLDLDEEALVSDSERDDAAVTRPLLRADSPRPEGATLRIVSETDTATSPRRAAAHPPAFRAETPHRAMQLAQARARAEPEAPRRESIALSQSRLDRLDDPTLRESHL